MQSLVYKENYADIIYLSLDTHKDCFGNVFMVLLMMIYGNYLGSGLNNFVATLYTFGLYQTKNPSSTFKSNDVRCDLNIHLKYRFVHLVNA